VVKLSRDGRVALYELPPKIPPVDAVRGTILALDWRALRTLGLYDRYAAALESGQRDALVNSTAGSWVSVATMLAHYRALDSLGLDDAAMLQVGTAVGDGVHGAFLATLIRLAGSLGVSPWRALEQSYKLWTRSWSGGAIAVLRTGERDAEVSLIACPVCVSRFFRTSFAGALIAGIAPFGKQPEVHEIAALSAPDGVTYRVRWAS
jgi:hypothetical protein